MCFQNNPILCSYFFRKPVDSPPHVHFFTPWSSHTPTKRKVFIASHFSWIRYTQACLDLASWWPLFCQILMVNSQASSYSSDQQHFTCWCHDLSRNAFFTWNVGNKTVLNFHLISLATLSQVCFLLLLCSQHLKLERPLA